MHVCYNYTGGNPVTITDTNDQQTCPFNGGSSPLLRARVIKDQNETRKVSNVVRCPLFRGSIMHAFGHNANHADKCTCVCMYTMLSVIISNYYSEQ